MSIINKLRFPYSDDKVFSFIFLLVIFVPLAFAPNLSDPYEGFKFSLYSIFLGLISIFLFLKRKTIVYNQKLLIVMGVFLLWAIISAIFSLDPFTSLIEVNLRFTSSVYFYILWLLSILVFWQNLTYEKMKFLLKGLVVSSLAISVFEIMQSFGFAHYEGLNAPVRPFLTSFLGNPNFVSMFIVGLVPVAIVLGLQATTKISKAFYLVTTFILMWGVALSSSRGSMLALIVELGALGVIALVYWRKIAIPLLFAGLMAVLLVFGFYEAYRPDTTAQTFELSEKTVQSRFEAWDQMFTIIANYPVLGTGPGNILIAYHAFSPAAFANEQVFDDAHNIVLNMAVSGGIPLSILFLAILALTFYYGYFVIAKKQDLLITAVVTGLLGLFISMNFNPVVVGCWLLFAVFISFITFQYSDKTVEISKTYRIVFITLGACIALIGLLNLLSSILAPYVLKSYVSGDLNRAYNFSNIAIKLNPLKNDIATYRIASAIKLGKDPAEIDRMMASYMMLKPTASGTFLNMSTLQVIRYNQTQDKKYLSSSYAYMSLAEKAAPNFGALLTKKAYLQYTTGYSRGALLTLDRVLTIQNQPYYNWILRAKTLQELNDKKGMIQSLESAQKIFPNKNIQKVIESAKQTDDVSKVDFSIYFPPIDITQ